MWLLFLCAISVGAAVPIQTAANTALRERLHSPFLAALINSSVGATIITLALILWPHAIAFDLQELSEQPWWMWTGGVIAVVFLVGSIFIMQHLGALGTALSVLTGSVCGGMILDSTGLLRVPMQDFTPIKGLGLILALVGFALVLKLPTKFKQHQQAINPRLIPFALLGIVGGVLQVTQSAVNSELSLHIGSSIAAGLVTMLQSMLILLVIIACKGEKLRSIFTLPLGKGSWIFCGGLCGASYLIVNALLLKVVGAGPLVILNLAGQLTAALLIDRVAWLGAKRQEIYLSQIVGLVIVFAAVALIKNPF